MYSYFLVIALLVSNLKFFTISLSIFQTEEVCSCQPNFSPSRSNSLAHGNYINWAQQIQLQDVRIATPKTTKDVVTLTNWAYQKGYQIRAKGFMHNWSPLVVNGDEGSFNKIILVDTTVYLTKMKMKAVSSGEVAVQVETGASLEALLTFLEANNKGILGHPAPGDITIGGALAIGGHGTGIPLTDQQPNTNTGTLSNLIISLNAVVWNGNFSKYEIRTFDRNKDPETRAMLTHLGRMFITEVTLQVGPLLNLRCLSRLDISTTSLFAIESTGGQDLRLSTFIENSGAVEVIWFPFTKNPWLKVWSVTPTKPLFSRPTNHPFNYPFSDNISIELSNLVSRLFAGEWSLAEIFGNLNIAIVGTGLAQTFSFDLWGPSKNLLLYVKPTTLRVTANGYVIIINRSNIQSVINQFTTFYEELISSFAEKRLYPINGPLEIRVTGVDTPVIQGTSPPTLSALKPIQGQGQLDTAIWLDCLSFPDTPHLAEFMTQVEEFIVNNFGRSTVARVMRPEWSKGFAYTNTSAWSNTKFLSDFIPSAVGLDDWTFTLNVFNKYDPNKVFTNNFLDKLFN